MFPVLVNTLWIIFQVVVGSYLVFPFVSYIIFSLKTKGPKLIQNSKESNDYALIVTAYKNFSNLNHVIDSILKLNHDNYIIYVVADDCPEFQDEFNDERVVILNPGEILPTRLNHIFMRSVILNETTIS